MVMYRDFAMRKARRLNIAGTVRNLSDGTVEIIAQGSSGALNDYLKKLRQGSLFARVERVDIQWRDPIETMRNFVILF